MGSLKIDLLGTSFTINANEDDAYLQKLLGYYKKIILQIQRSGSLTHPVQVSALAGIMLCDELYKEKSKLAQLEQAAPSISSEQEQNDSEAQRITSELIEKINRALQ
ncbi:MAG: cell division protein ZapA [Treponema sp.]|nr:cell division protein ZapA [Candidatus Treponema equifaecale]